MQFEIYIVKDKEEMSRKAFEIFEKELSSKKILNAILATGNTPTGLYNLMRESGLFNSDNFKSWNLDEYAGSTEYKEFMEAHLIQELNLLNSVVPPGNLIDPSKLEQSIINDKNVFWQGGTGFYDGQILMLENATNPYLTNIRDSNIQGYLKSIEDAGGIDLALIGTGENGHIGFHEKSIPFNIPYMGIIKLSQNTIDNAVNDSDHTLETVPRYALSMTAPGVGMLSRKILLLANGERKINAIASSVLEQVSPDCPISILQKYAKKDKEVIYVIDEAAAKGIIGKERELSGKGINLHYSQP